MSIVETEQVLVVPTALFHELGHFQGFSQQVDRYLDVLLDPVNISYRPRSEMEKDPSFKQLIPYVLFQYTDSEGQQRVFQYTRGSGMGEGRLHRKRSVGIGGHIAVTDAAGAPGTAAPYEEGMRRELDEEVFIETSYDANRVGLINDDQTEVGTVHLGIVHRFDVVEPAVRPREAEIVDAAFQPVEQILAELSQFETWSQICMRALFADGLSGASRGTS